MPDVATAALHRKGRSLEENRSLFAADDRRSRAGDRHAGYRSGARRLGLSRADEITAVFCGSKKSLASGLPLAQVLFAGAAGFGMIVLPIMLYNQIQIMVGAMLARRYASGGLGASGLRASVVDP
ncbi:bile acid:sodium symporter [Paracoccus yeei]|uniref:bile acid:sodium symporter n=1 Tax=Paracoccus yeei TaxID=147645 RepID=UPI001C2BD4B7|nr:bile acid:sodium symporter [Paracoccus yeei]